MVKGVNTPYEKKLLIEGIGFKVELKGKDLNFALGFSHPIKVVIPEGLHVTTEKNTITISGIDKEQVGQFTAKLRALKNRNRIKEKVFVTSEKWSGENRVRSPRKSAAT